MSPYILSICIPTKDRPSNIQSTLESILSENVDHSQIQIVVSDNSSDNATLDILTKFGELNIKYYRNPILGFFNSIEALRQGDGEFLKLQNDYTAFKPGGLSDILHLVEKELSKKTQILFTGGALKIRNEIFRTSSFDMFIQKSEYFNTWSTAYSIWRSDFISLMNNADLEINDQFPHTSLLFENSKKSDFVIYDKEIYDNQSVSRKGGYNIFYNFCVVYSSILKKYIKNDTIKEETYAAIIKNMSYKFIARWLAMTVFCKKTRTNFSFDSSNYKNNISSLYGNYGFMKIKYVSLIFSLLLTVRFKNNAS